MKPFPSTHTEPVQHYCLICQKIEKCSGEKCNYSKMLLVHIDCFAILTPAERREHEKIIAMIDPKKLI